MMEKHKVERIVSLVVHEQDKPTCYAYAIATAVRTTLLNSKRKDETPDHDELRTAIEQQFSWKPANVEDALKWVCSQRNLKYSKVSEYSAQLALTKKQGVVALFWYDMNQRTKISEFYRKKKNKKKILMSKHIMGHYNQRSNFKYHAAAVVEYKDKSWTLKNSWGRNSPWGYKGHLRVHKSAFFKQIEFYVVTLN